MIYIDRQTLVDYNTPGTVFRDSLDYYSLSYINHDALYIYFHYLNSEGTPAHRGTTIIECDDCEGFRVSKETYEKMKYNDAITHISRIHDQNNIRVWDIV